MRALVRAALVCATLLVSGLIHVPDAHGQSDILLQLRSGSPAGDRFRVDSAGGFVAFGTLGIGIIPASGAGQRAMWYPWRACFRVGEAQSNEWDHDNCGFYTFAGGLGSRARGIYSISWGHQNVADAQAAVALGSSNILHGTSPDFAIGGVALGLSNEVFKTGGVAIGRNATSGVTGTPTGGGGTGAVAIGFQVEAQGDHTLALGNRVSTGGRIGAIVIGDRSVTTGVPIIASANNQFNVRAAGGYRLFSNSGLTSGMTMAAGGSTWNAVSDVNRKENFAEVDDEDVLLRLRSVPVTSWNYIAEGAEVRHIGPMAQDWHAAFRLNDDPLTINQGDFDGVNLAAIRALERRTAELPALTAELARLSAANARLEAELAELREQLRALLTPPSP